MSLASVGLISGEEGAFRKCFGSETIRGIAVEVIDTGRNLSMNTKDTRERYFCCHEELNLESDTRWPLVEFELG